MYIYFFRLTSVSKWWTLSVYIYFRYHNWIVLSTCKQQHVNKVAGGSINENLSLIGWAQCRWLRHFFNWQSSTAGGEEPRERQWRRREELRAAPCFRRGPGVFELSTCGCNCGCFTVNWVTASDSAMSEKTPLLHYRLTSSGSPTSKDESLRSGAQEGRDGRRSRDKSATARKLGVVFGVVTPTVLSMFSVVVFLRIGEWRERRGNYFMKVFPLKKEEVLNNSPHKSGWNGPHGDILGLDQYCPKSKDIQSIRVTFIK